MASFLDEDNAFHRINEKCSSFSRHKFHSLKLGKQFALVGNLQTQRFKLLRARSCRAYPLVVRNLHPVSIPKPALARELRSRGGELRVKAFLVPIFKTASKKEFAVDAVFAPLSAP
jgi:hypothetical protein